LEGEDLGQHIRRVGVMSVADCLNVSRAIADGVGFAHRHHIVHRDLKPDNIFLSQGNHPQAAATIKVLDFGIAKLVETDARGSRTGTGVLLGTPLFMSPEQCRGTGLVDHRSDIYSLGCIMYTMLVGTPPFPYEGFGEILAAHLGQAPPRLSAARPDAPPQIDAFVSSLLTKNREDRPSDMESVVAEIDRLAATLGVAVGPSLVGAGSARGSQSGFGRDARPRALADTRPLPLSLLETATPPFVGGTQKLPSTHVRPRFAQGPEKLTTLAGAVRSVESGRSRGLQSGARGSRYVFPALFLVLLAGGVAAWRWNDIFLPTDEGARTGAAAGKRYAVRAPTPEPSDEAATGTPPSAPAQRTPEPPILASDSDEAPRAVAPAPSDSATPSASRFAVIRFASTPSAAEIVDSDSGRLFGQTPFEARFPRDGRILSLRVRKTGYRTKDLRVTLDSDRELSVVLRKPVSKKPAEMDDENRKL